MTPRTPKSDDYAIRAAVVALLLAGGVDRAAIRHEITLDTSSSGGRVDLLIAEGEALVGI